MVSTRTLSEDAFIRCFDSDIGKLLLASALKRMASHVPPVSEDLIFVLIRSLQTGLAERAALSPERNTETTSMRALLVDVIRAGIHSGDLSSDSPTQSLVAELRNLSEAETVGVLASCIAMLATGWPASEFLKISQCRSWNGSETSLLDL